MIEIETLRKNKEELKTMFAEIARSTDFLEGGYYDIVMSFKTSEIKKLKKFDSDPENQDPWISLSHIYKMGRAFDDPWIKEYIKKPCKNFNTVVKMFELNPQWKGK